MIKNETQTSKWIVDNYKDELLFVDDSFQRRYVWQEKHKIALMETILMGYAIPEIYIWNVGTDSETGNTKRSIVDGQQRIGALVSFINNEYSLKKNYLLEENKDLSFSGKKFDELNATDKNKIWKYSFTLRLILEEVKREDIVKLFLRLNCTDKSLNPQELRNAEFNGKFLETAEQIGSFDFWSDYKIFSPDSIRRMGDIEFISSLLMFLRFGIESEINQKAINKAYDLFENEYEESSGDIQLTSEILEVMKRVVVEDEGIVDYLRKTSHFYTIFTTIYKVIAINGIVDDEFIKKICCFYSEYNNDVEYMVEYRACMVEATRSKQSRFKRTEILSKYIGI